MRNETDREIHVFESSIYGDASSGGIVSDRSMKVIPLPVFSFLGVVCLWFGQASAQVINIEDRVELFADDFLVEKTEGDVRRVLQKPEPKEVVFTADKPWESSPPKHGGLAYTTIFQDGDLYRMYYRGNTSKSGPDGAETKGSNEVFCYAESRDGIHWERPELGLVEWEGNKNNNIFWAPQDSSKHNFSPFKDANPEAETDSRYKAIGQKRSPRAYRSKDAIHWDLVEDKGLVKLGTFDSHNIAFWDGFRQEYRMYWRHNPLAEGGGIHDRAIRTAFSKDFKVWEGEQNLQYPSSPEPQKWEETAQLYTSAIQPYFRAPQIFVGFPTRMLITPVARAQGKISESTYPLFMMSRDGVRFTRWDEPVIPQDAPQDRTANRSNYMAWGMLQLPGSDDEISVYAAENTRGATAPRLRRFVYRLDGFVALEAGAKGGEVITKALLFAGEVLKLNYRAREGGELKVEIQDEEGAPLEGFRLEDCQPLKGDGTREIVRWKGGDNLSGAPSQESVRLRFVMRNIELYSMQFSATE